MAQIHANQLMLGDWVKNDLGEIQQIQQLKDGWVMLDYNDWYEEKDIEPIPLTHEILEENAFKKEFERLDSCSDYGCYYRINKYVILCDNGEFGYDICTEYKDTELGWQQLPFATVHNVHELQHILKDCNIEKKIVL